jgi:ribosome-binding factor A
MSQRLDRLADLVRSELATLLQREMRDPRIGLATVTRVDLSRDLGHAVIHVSALGSEEQRAGAVAALEHAKGFLRRELAHRLSLRTTPELKFVLDRGAEHSQRISDLLDELHTGDDHGS